MFALFNKFFKLLNFKYNKKVFVDLAFFNKNEID